MAAAAERSGQTQEQLRYLTEVYNLVDTLSHDGTVPPAVERDIRTNLFTAVQEMAIPSAVTTTVQRVEHVRDIFGRSKRVITWLGKSAVQVAESGYEFHATPAAHRRVDVEVAEARDAQENLTVGVAKVFISPRMSAADASAAVAKSENLYEADSLRVSVPVLDAHGQIVARRTQSVLVKDVPLRAWVNMLQNPANIFGKVIPVHDHDSALSVMQVFRELEVSENRLPQGPVSLLKELVGYIPDAQTKASVVEQITMFENDQELYTARAEQAAETWFEFETNLALSMRQGTANLEIERFIATLQHEWKPDELAAITAHDVAGQYIVTNELATVLEKKFRQTLIARVSIQTGNVAVLKQTDAGTASYLQKEIQSIELLRSVPYKHEEVLRREAILMRTIARQDFAVGGGCGNKLGGVKDSNNPVDPAEVMNNESGKTDTESSQESKIWKWKPGVCRVQSCPSPKPTEVGPCSVCRGCQRKFDRGLDPTRDPLPVTRERPQQQKLKLSDYLKNILQPADKSYNKKNVIHDTGQKTAAPA